ncbi:ketopantoate reductase family protein, partial [Paraburkholderia caledonica]|uniref:ketopantoate reductase family protein n=1 Tax=Paraburkholderia caledonica TaxID=134536 RepID=UPI003C9E10DF
MRLLKPLHCQHVRGAVSSFAFKETHMKIAFLGAGALGCAIGSALTEGGHETWLIDRSAAHVEAMSRDGLQVDDER